MTTSAVRPQSTLRRVLALVVMLVALTWGVPAQAHDYIVDSTPATNATYDTVPPRIEIEFSAEIIPASPAMLILDGDGNVIWEAIPDLEGRTAVIEFPSLNDGSYTLAWSLVSSDGHRVEGGIPFSMTAGVTDGPVADPDAAPPTGTLPTATQEGPFDAIPLWVKILIGVAALGGAATVLLIRSRKEQ